jgi:adenylate cyclase class 2
MAKNTHREEIEIKLRVSDIAAIRSRLKNLRARKISSRAYESNTLYDTPRGHLRRRGQLIRIRTEQPAANFGKKGPSASGPAILTYKGPPPLSPDSGKTSRRLKARSHLKVKEEAEVSLRGATDMRRILRALGLEPSFRYEKFRTTYTLPGIAGLKIELDETPIGIYIELEGSPAAIHRGARLLGYDRNDYLKDTYGSLYLAACRKLRRKPGDMLFSPTKKLR